MPAVCTIEDVPVGECVEHGESRLSRGQDGYRVRYKDFGFEDFVGDCVGSVGLR